jgi:hypothetical protein
MLGICPNCQKQHDKANKQECCSGICGLEWRKRSRLEKQTVSPEEKTEVRSVPGLLQDEIESALKKRPYGLRELCDLVDKSPGSVEGALRELKARSRNVEILGDRIALVDTVIPGGEPLIIHPLKNFKGKFRKFGALGDNHLGSKHERLDVLNALYDVYEDEGVTDVFNTGNMIEGEKGKLNFHDIKVFGLDDQVDYFLENYPQRKGITTHYVTGDDHEGWYQQRERINIGEHIENRARAGGREDLHHLGYVEGDVKLETPSGNRVMKIMHPGGGSAYALSYAAQKLVESFQGGEKPAILLYGHYHKMDYNYYREVHCVGTGCTVDQSVFMRKNKIAAHVGGLLIELNQEDEGAVNRFKLEWIPFYDRNFYIKKVM